MLFDPPIELTDELIRRHTAVAQAQANFNANASAFNLALLNAARKALDKTVDKCSVELGQPTTPRPTVQVDPDDGTLKLLYPTP